MNKNILNKRRAVLAIAISSSVVHLTSLQSLAAGGTWTNIAGGAWGTTSNWNPVAVPGSTAGDVIDFSTLNITAAAAVTLDGNRTAGTLKFGDTTSSFFGWTLNTGTGTNTLTLASGTTAVPSIDVGGTNSAISATINSAVAGTQGLTKTGSGTLTIAATANPLTGPMTVSAGTLNVTTLGGIITTYDITGVMNVSGVTTVNSSLSKTSAGTLSFNGAVSGWANANNNGVTAGTLVLGTGSGISFDFATVSKTSGAGTVQYNSVSSLTLPASYSVGAGGITLSTTSTLTGTSGFSKTGAGILTFTGGSINVGGTYDTSVGQLVIGSTLTPTASTTFTGTSTTTISGVVAGTLGFTKTGSGALNLNNNANINTGTVTVTSSTLAIGNAVDNQTYANAFSKIILNAATLSFAGSSSSTYTHTYNFAGLTAPISLTNSALNFGSTNATTKAFNAAVDFSGSNTINYSSTNFTHNLNLNKAITGSGTLTFNWSGTSTNRNITLAAGQTNNFTGAVILNSTPTAGNFTINSALGASSYEVRNAWTLNNNIAGGMDSANSVALINSGSVLTLTQPFNNSSATLALTAGTVNVGNATSTFGNLSGAVGTVIQGTGASSTLAINQTVDGTYAGSLTQTSSNTLSFTKNGAAKLTYSGSPASTYSGNTTINAGTLALTGATNNIPNSAAISIGTNGTFDVSGVTGGFVTGAQKLGGSGTVIGNVATGSTSTINPGGDNSKGTITFNNNLTLNASKVSYDLNTTDTIGAGVNDLLSVSGTLDATGTNTIYISTLAPLAPGTYNYRLANYGTLGGSGGTFLLDTSALGTRNLSYALDTSTANQINLSIVSNSASLVWVGNDGTNPTYWDTNTTSNFLNGVTPVSFFDSDSVTFDDTASSFTVALQNNVSPNSVTVNNSTNPYVFSGASKTIASNNFVKQGSSSLTLSGITLNVLGTLDLQGGGTFDISTGASTAGTVILTSGTYIGSGSLSASAFDLRSGYVSTSLTGTGAITKSTTGTVVLTGSNTNTGGTTVNAGKLQVGNGGTISSLTGGVSIASAGTLNFKYAGTPTISNNLSGTGTVSFTGTGTVSDSSYTLTGANSSFTGKLVAESGSRIASGSLASLSGAAVVVNSGGEVYLQNAITYPNSFSIAGNGWNETISSTTYALGAIRLSGNTVSGSITLTGDSRISAYASSGTLSGNIGGAYILELSNPAGSSSIALTGSQVNIGGLLIGPTSTTSTTVSISSGTTLTTSNSIQIGRSDASAGTSNQILNSTGSITNNGSLFIGRAATLNINGGLWTQNGSMSIYTQGGYGATLNINSGGSLTYTGTNSIVLNAGPSSTGSGALTIAGTGVLTTSAGITQTVTPTTGSAVITLGTGATIKLGANVTDLTPITSSNPQVKFAVATGGGVIDTNSYSASLSAAITGTNISLTKAGTGTLALTASNTYTGTTTVSGGTLQIGNGGTTGSITGTVNIASGSTLNYFRSGTAIPVGNTFTGSGTVSFSGTGVAGSSLYQSSFNASAFSGTFVINSGADVSVISATTLNSLPVTVSNGGELDLSPTPVNTFSNNFFVAGNGYTDVAGLQKGAIYFAAGETLTGTTTLIGDTRITAYNAVSVPNISGPIVETGGARKLELGGTFPSTTTFSYGTITVSGSNSYSGGTNVRNIVANANNSNAFGTGSVTVDGTDSATGTRIQLANGVNIPNSLTINATNPSSGRGVIEGPATGTATWSGNITSNAFPTAGGTFAGGGGMLIVSGSITSTLPISHRSGTVVLQGGGSYPSLGSNSGSLLIGANNGIATNASVSLAGSGNTTFDLNGFNQTLTNLSKITSVYTGTTTNSSGTPSTLTLNNTSDDTYIGTLTGNLSLTKSGAATLTLTGSNTYTGASSVNAGTLAVNGTHSGAGNYVVAASATLAGSGTITPAATKTVTVNGTLAPGNSGIGTLNIAGGVFLNGTESFEIDSTASTADKLNATGSTITLGGSSVLSVSDIAGVPNFTAGQTFDLFDGSFSGFFNTIALPTLPGTLIWKTFSGSQLDYTTGQIQVIANGPPSSTWNVNSDGNWSTASNWTTNTIPTGIGAIATFDSVILADHTVTVDSARTVGTLNFNNTNKYTIAGTSTLTLQGTTSAAINVTSGNHDITAPLALASNTTVTVGGSNTLKLTQLQPTTVDINKAGTGTMEVNNVTTTGALNISAGTVKVTPNGTSTGYSKINTLTTTGTGTLDITNNSAIITGTSESDVRTMITSGFNGGDWLGTGITSSNAANDNDGVTAVGYANNNDLGASDYNGVPLGATDTIVKYTYYGDADLSGTVTLEDFTQFLVGYQQGGTPNWINGDFDYSGTVTLEDFSLFLAGYQGPNTPLTPSLALALSADAPHSAPLAESISIVPEPTSLGLLAVGAMGLLRRRRK